MKNMQNHEWLPVWKIHIDEELEIELPLMELGNGFYIYSFDMTGESKWNRHAAGALAKKLAEYSYDGFVTVQTKSSGLCQELARDRDCYLELRKSRKAFMRDPKHVVYESTTQGNGLWVGRESSASRARSLLWRRGVDRGNGGRRPIDSKNRFEVSVMPRSGRGEGAPITRYSADFTGNIPLRA